MHPRVAWMHPIVVQLSAVPSTGDDEVFFAGFATADQRNQVLR